MVRHQTTAAGKNHRVLERVAQLADVPVPRPLLQRFEEPPPAAVGRGRAVLAASRFPESGPFSAAMSSRARGAAESRSRR